MNLLLLEGTAVASPGGAMCALRSRAGTALLSPNSGRKRKQMLITLKIKSEGHQR